jgi:hypothetical protein
MRRSRKVRILLTKVCELVGEGLLFNDVRVQNAILFKVVRYRILCQKWRLQPDFSADPLALVVRCIGSVITSSTASELGSKIGALNLIELLDLAPGCVTYRTGNVDLQSHHCHYETPPTHCHSLRNDRRGLWRNQRCNPLRLEIPRD